MNRRRLLGLSALALAAASRPAAALSLFRWQEDYPLLIGGASSMLPLTRALVAGFLARRDDVDVVATGGGGDAGLMALKRGAIDLAAMAGDLSGTQDEACVHNYLLARDAAVAVVHPDNPLTALPTAAMAALFTGRLTDWRDLGAPAAPVEVVVRRNDPLLDLLLQGADPTDDALSLPETRDVAALVLSNRHAIGCLPLKAATPPLRALAADGVTARRETVFSGRYPLLRSYYYVLCDNGAQAAIDFVAFAIGPEGRRIVDATGLWPMF
ncbi:phosphate-binding protein PstS 2 precursor [mine drainage metagenome]|uniref:Phosphate-binding protein PstS 2 n=1 Tax=mine drainage metagenome TaxID=410659 RepID=A0A1J5RRK7_9ZZZZ